jgi:hypothetical protein
MPTPVLDPHREIELQGPRAFAIQGVSDYLMCAKTLGFANAGERPRARSIPGAGDGKFAHRTSKSRAAPNKPASHFSSSRSLRYAWRLA